MNIYKRQMLKLGVNTYEYSKLIDMPYDIVKNYVYEKEGDYDMNIRNILNKNMISKHQEIEQDIDNAKIKANEIKLATDEEYIKWYDEEYTRDLLFKKLHINSLIEFQNKYLITINGKPASKWFYVMIVGKTNYEGHPVRQEIKSEFVKQLYDIIVCDNASKYLREEGIQPIKRDKYKKNIDKNLKSWFENFDINEFKKTNNLTNITLGLEIGVSKATIDLLIAKKRYTNKTLKNLYDYVMSKENNVEINDEVINESVKEIDNENLTNEIRKAQINGETDKVEELKEQHYENLLEEDDNNPSSKITMQVPEIHHEDVKDVKIENMDLVKLLAKEIKNELQTQYNEDYDKLKKMLISKLTEEEKELITLFGGKITF